MLSPEERREHVLVVEGLHRPLCLVGRAEKAQLELGDEAIRGITDKDLECVPHLQ